MMLRRNAVSVIYIVKKRKFLTFGIRIDRFRQIRQIFKFDKLTFRPLQIYFKY